MDNNKKLGFFKLYVKNFKAMLLTNLLFAVPLIISAAVVYGAAVLLNQTENLWFMGIIIILIYPFFSGVTQVTKDIVRNQSSNFNVFKTYKKGLKNNFWYFTLYGVLFYLATIISYYSIVIYFNMISRSWIFYIPLFMTIVVALFILFMAFSLPIITVTLDLKLRYYFKNSALMAIGELPMNFYVAITTFALLSASFSISVFTGYVIAGIIVLAVALFFILPTGISYCAVYRLYPKLENVFEIKSADEEKSFPTMPVAIPTDDNGEPVVKTDNNDNDGYVFVNGRMIKKSQVSTMEYIDESD